MAHAWPHVYLTSLGSRGFFPENDNSSFANMLQRPLIDMRNYKVRLAACHIPSLSPADTVVVCSNIVSPTFFNESQIPVLGVYSGSAGNVIHTYSDLMSNTISLITCNLVDIAGNKLSLNTAPLIVLEFKHK